MNDWQRRVTGTIGIVVTTLLSYALIYQWGMQAYENESVLYVQALQVVIEAITTAGFGGHAPWSSPQMNAMVLFMNLTGVLFVFLAVPLFAVPVLRDAFEQRPPESFSGEGHIVLAPHTSRVEALIGELEAQDRPYVILEPDRDRAKALYMDGYPVVHGDPESVSALRGVGLEAASALVVDGRDEVDTSVILSAREISDEIKTVAVIEDRALAPYHRMAGTDHVLSPRQLLGEGLAGEIPFLLRMAEDATIGIGEDLEVAELDVEPGSPLCDQTIGHLRLRERFGIDVIGAWFDGTFESPVGPETTVDCRARLLVSGAPERIQALRREDSSTLQMRKRQRVIVVGYGQSGQAAVDVLADTEAQLTIIDAKDLPNVDVVGDARDPSVYEEADVGAADAIVIDLDDDTTTLLATLIARDANPEAHIVARANKEENERKIYRAGADYVQSLATISGRMMAATVLDREEVLSFRTKIDVVRFKAEGLAGRTLAGADVRAETGCTVVAAVRNGDVVTSLDPEAFTFRDDDQLVVVGTDEGVHRFEDSFLR
ncbi:potassium channel family protein [Salinibacter grassmerensis]|uniref:potassium channel family protein n=1 Tax=Salinibacter grassmerensis TaxID=3040353 RepID=UPI0021E77383|nr:potassium channel protein [Salinibacter grassmerensis]